MLDNNGVHPITYTAKAAEQAYKEAEQEFKFELEEPQKVVDYFGLKLVVPNDNGWLATDKNGEIYFHDDYPEVRNNDSCRWQCLEDNCNYTSLGRLKSMPYTDWWKESLIEV